MLSYLAPAHLGIGTFRLLYTILEPIKNQLRTKLESVGKQDNLVVVVTLCWIQNFYRNTGPL